MEKILDSLICFYDNLDWSAVWNSSLSSIDPDPPPIVHRDPPEGVETKSKRHPPETVIIENVTGEVKRGFVNITDAQSGN